MVKTDINAGNSASANRVKIWNDRRNNLIKLILPAEYKNDLYQYYNLMITKERENNGNNNS